jgi:hypothetical protein
MEKRGVTLLLKNIILIILTVVFIGILITFITIKSGSSGVLEEKYAKEIALVLDSSRPGMEITLNMADAVSAAQKNLGKNNIKNLVTFSGNVVTVRLGVDSGYSYSFFNSVNIVNYYFDEANNNYVFFIGDYNA